MIVKNEEIAGEALQDTFLKVWNSIEDYDESKGRLYTWMARIARNVAIDKTRTRDFRELTKSERDTLVNYGKDGTLSFQPRPEQMDIRKLVELLKPDEKKLIDLMYFEGYTQSEISEEFDIPLGTVKTKVRTAMKKLRGLF